MQVAIMYWEYLKAVLARALQPTVRVTDGLQILAASASPAVGKLLGIKMPETTGNDIFAYIGAAALVFIVIRLFWAPYAIWKDQISTNAELRLELSKPERLVIEALARRRAKARVKLVQNITDVMHHSFFFNDKNFKSKDLAKYYKKGLALCGQSGLGDNSIRIYTRLMNYSHAILCEKNEHREALRDLGYNFSNYVNGAVTYEVLLLQLPPKLETEAPPKTSPD